MKPIAKIAIMIGDPAGIGPEVVIKAVATNSAPAHLVLVGDAGIVARTITQLDVPLAVQPISTYEEARFEAGVLPVLDPGTLDSHAVRTGEVSAECGRAVVEWWDLCTRLALERHVDAIVKAPVHFDAIRRSGQLPAVDSGVRQTYLLLLSGALRVAHLTDHIPLRDVMAEVTQDKLLTLLRVLHTSLTQWGVERPRIGVAGLNPHADGAEESRDIAPAVERARGEGVNAEGPVAPDSLFRMCLANQFDCALALYHDQGHIAVKTDHFQGNCAIVLGEPFLRLSVAHGTAFDIAGQGIASADSMQSALSHAISLGTGKGFPTP